MAGAYQTLRETGSADAAPGARVVARGSVTTRHGAPAKERAPRSLADLRGLLAPRSIAVIGASDAPGNLGGVAVRYLRRFGYPGEVWPINPKRTSVDGIACYPNVAVAPGAPDLTILAVPARLTPDMVRECAAAGGRNGIIWAGGFSELGGGGTELQSALSKACQETGFSLVGPNCLGIIDTHLPAVCTFASFLGEVDGLIPGNVSMVSQSGGLATQAHALAQDAGFGFRYMISSGNEADLTFADFVNVLVDDTKTKVIAGYVEGVRDGGVLIHALTRARDVGKPVVVLKAGTAPASARAATAHTGALVGEDRVWRAIADEMGVVQVTSVEELLDVSLFLSTTGLTTLPRGNRVAVVTFGGGGGVLSADQCVRAGLTTPPLGAATRERLRSLVPSIASVHNPVDLTPQSFNDPDYLARFPDTLQVIAEDPNIDMVLGQFGPMSNGAPEVMEAIVRLREASSKTVCLSWSFAPNGVYEQMRKHDFHVFHEPAHAVNVLGKLARRDSQVRVDTRPAHSRRTFDWARFVPSPTASEVITEDACHRILAAAGIPVPAGGLVRLRDDLPRVLATVTFPVAMKGISSQVTHRDAAGLLSLDVRTEEEAKSAYGALSDRALSANVALEGIYVQDMVPGGEEVFVSAFRDPIFGVMVSCGTGGTMAEIVDDVALARAPLDPASAVSLLRRLRLVQHAERSGSSTGLDRLGEFLAEFSELVASAPWRRFVLEVNPVKWTPEGAIAVDGLLVVETP